MNSLTSRTQVLLLLICMNSANVAFAQKQVPDKPLVVSTSSVFANMVSVIGGNLIESVSIVPVGKDPHIYVPTSKDEKLLAKADLLLQNGLDYDIRFSELVKKSNTKARLITLTEGIIPIISKKNQNVTDPHAWLDPVNGKIYAHNIKNALLQLLPDHNEQIVVQFDAYLEELYKLDEYVRKSVAGIDSNKRVLITSHDSFLYFGRQYGLKLESVQGTSTDANVTAPEHLNEVIQKHKVSVVFSESTIKPKLIKKLAHGNSLSIGGILYSDSLGDEDGPAGTYVKMIRQNTDVIVAGLTSSMKLSGASISGISSQTLRFFIMSILAISIGVFLIRRRIFAK